MVSRSLQLVLLICLAAAVPVCAQPVIGLHSSSASPGRLGLQWDAEPEEEDPLYPATYLGGSREGPVVWVIANHLWRSPEPFVMWADPDARIIPCAIPQAPSLEQRLADIFLRSGPHRLYHHEGFAEIVFATVDRERELRARMGEEVPPIAFHNLPDHELPRVWEAVSGQTMTYDERLLAPAEPDTVAPGPLAGLPDPLAAWPATPDPEPEPLWDSVFPSVRLTQGVVDEIASHLGAVATRDGDGWVLAPIRGSAEGRELIRQLIDEYEANDWGHGDAYGNTPPWRRSEDIRRLLVQAGAPAGEELLLAYEAALDAGRFGTSRLLWLLMDRPSTRRDALFIRALEAAIDGGPEALWGHAGRVLRVIVDALAANGCEAAVPILRCIAEEFPSLRSDVSLALNQLGAPLPPRRPEGFLEAPQRHGDPENQPRLALLYAILDQCLVPAGERWTFILAPWPATGVWHCSVVAQDQPKQWVSVGEPKGDRARFVIHDGPWSTVGRYDGLAELRDGRWLVTFLR